MDPDDDDNFSQYSYSEPAISGHSAELRNMKASHILRGRGDEGSCGERMDRWSLEDLMDRHADSWHDDLHEVTSAWSDMVYPRVQALYARFGSGPLDCDIGEVQHMLLLAAFLQVDTSRNMTECLRALTHAAFSAWYYKNRRARRSLWNAALKFARDWEFSPVLACGIEERLKQVIRVCLDHHLIYAPSVR